MKKSFIVVLAVFAVIIIFGALTPVFTQVGDYHFNNGWTVTINNEVYSQEDFDEYLETVETYLTQQGVAYESKQAILNEFDEKVAVLYDFYALNAEQKTAIETFLAAQSYVSYAASDIRNDGYIKAVIYAAIGAGIVLVLQFLYYLFVHKKFFGIDLGIAATINSLSAFLVTIAFSLILALIGVRFAPLTISAVLLVLLASVFVNAALFEKVKYNVVTRKMELEEAKQLALSQNKKLLALFFAPLMVAALVVATVFMTNLLSFGLTLLWGLVCLYIQVMFLTLQLWKSNKKQ